MPDYSIDWSKPLPTYGQVPQTQTIPSWMSPGTAQVMGYQGNQQLWPAFQKMMPNLDSSLEGVNAYDPKTYGSVAAKPELGWNPGTFQMGFQGLSTLGNLWGGYQANKIAKQQLALSKEFGNANLNNSIKSYNTELEHKAALRDSLSSNKDSPEALAAQKKYIEENRLSR